MLPFTTFYILYFYKNKTFYILIVAAKVAKKMATFVGPKNGTQKVDKKEDKKVPKNSRFLTLTGARLQAAALGTANCVAQVRKRLYAANTNMQKPDP